MGRSDVSAGRTALLWIKFVLAGLIIAFCTLLGWFASGKYRARRSFYLQFNELNNKYLSELKFARKPLTQFLKESRFKGDFEKFVGEFSRSRNVKTEYSYLTQTEKEYVAEYFSMLGRGDSHSQSGYFTAQSEGLNQKKEAIEKEAKSRSELYLKLGLLAGLAFVILIV